MMPDFLNMMSLSSMVNVVLFPLSSFLSKFHFNIITGSGVIMTSFVYKALTRYLEYGNTRLWIFPYNWALKWASNRQFSANISNKKLLNAVKVHGYSFYHFWVIKGKRTVGYNYSPTRTSELINFREGEAKNNKGPHCF